MALQTLEGDLIPMRPAKEILTRYAVLLLGAAILSFGLFNVHSQSGVTEGGVLGTTLLLHHWFGISPGVSEFVIDVICYALGFRFLGKAFFKYAIAASAGFACFYMLWERVGPVLPDLSGQPLIAALLGGVFVGVGVGLVVRAGGASGGDDVLALLLNKFTKLTLSKSYFMTDAIVLALSLTYIPAGRIVFSFITVTLSSFLIERIQRIDVARSVIQAHILNQTFLLVPQRREHRAKNKKRARPFDRVHFWLRTMVRQPCRRRSSARKWDFCSALT